MLLERSDGVSAAVCLPSSSLCVHLLLRQNIPSHRHDSCPPPHLFIVSSHWISCLKNSNSKKQYAFLTRPCAISHAYKWMSALIYADSFVLNLNSYVVKAAQWLAQSLRFEGRMCRPAALTRTRGADWIWVIICAARWVWMCSIFATDPYAPHHKSICCRLHEATFAMKLQALTKET